VTTATRNAREVTVSKSVMEQAAAAAESAMRERSAYDIAAEIEARVQAKLDAAKEGLERAELERWWDIWAIGPIQPTIGTGPVQPGCVVKQGEVAYAVSILVLNPFLPLPGPSNAAKLLSDFGLPYEVSFQTSNLTSMVPAGNDVQAANFVPGTYVYVNVTQLPSNLLGMHETNILARIEGAGVPASAPQFGGFATAILDLDGPGLFGPGAGVNFNQPIRYVVYP
jgi:hypothetical protein